MLALESDHPESLAAVVELRARADDRLRVSTRATEPASAIEAIEPELLDTITEFNGSASKRAHLASAPNRSFLS